jgi:hypothetical protein
MVKKIKMAGLLIGVLFLGACQALGIGSDSGPGASYPYPVGDIIYTSTPRPEPEPGQSVYPEVVDNSEVIWNKAEALIRHGEVARIVLLDAIRFQMFLKDGRILVSGRPAIDSIQIVIQECGELCADIVVEE